MKTEERHRLKTNALGAALDNFWRGLWDGTSTTTLYVGGLIILLAVGAIVGWMIYSSIYTESRSKLWIKVGEASNLDDMDTIEKVVPAKQLEYVTGKLNKLAKDNPGTIAARIAQFEEARLLLRNGLERLGSALTGIDPEALESLTKAGKLYARLADESSGMPVLQQEALMGAAKAHESVGDIDKAKPFYKRLAAAAPESDLTKQAKTFLENLEGPDSAQITKLYDKIREDLAKNAPPPK